MPAEDPLFFLGSGATDYRLFNEDADAWLHFDAYRRRRDEMLAVYRLGSHDPRLWLVSVPTGGEAGGLKDMHLIRCEACGQWTPLPKRPRRKSSFHDLSGRRIKERQTVCSPVSSAEMASAVYRKHRSEQLWVRGVFGAMLALMAVGFLFMGAGAPVDKRAWGYFGCLIWATASVIVWVSFFRIYRSEQASQDTSSQWRQH
jgi:hypothetical protein